MESLLDFACRMESRLKSLGFEFEYQSPDTGSRYYIKDVRYHIWDDGTIIDMDKPILRVRVSDHLLPDRHENDIRGNHDFELIHCDLDESIDDVFADISKYHWDKPQ